MIKLLIADERSPLREKLRHVQDLELVDAIPWNLPWPNQTHDHLPDIAIVDLANSDSHQSSALALQNTTTKLLLLGCSEDKTGIDQAWSLGAKGYLERDASTDDILHAIRTIDRGYLHFESTALERLARMSQGEPEEKLEGELLTDLDEFSLYDSSPEAESALEVSTQEWSSLTKELVDTTPKVWTRGILYFLIVFAAIALPWAMFSKVDETGIARGRLEPTGKTWQLDAPVGGSINQVTVKEGDTVKAGQVLVTFDTELIIQDLQQREAQADGQRGQLQQLEVLRHQLVVAINTQRQQNQSQQLEKQAQVQQANQSVDSTRTELELQAIEKRSPINQAEAALSASRKNLTLARQRHTKDQKEVSRFRRLYQQGVIPEVQVVEKEQAAADSQRLLTQAESDVEQAKLRLAEAKRQYQTLLHQARSNVEQSELRLLEQQESLQGFSHSGNLAILKSEEELKNLDRQVSSLKSEITQTNSQIKALQHQLSQHQIKAPVAGTIFTLPVSRAGAVVQPGTRLAELSPADSPMILKAQMATSESGSLRKGMSVKLKFDAYPYQDYGIFSGKVIGISPTSKVSDAAPGQLPSYDLDIQLENACIQTATICAPLTPGQTATAEVIVRQRRIIDFIIDPFKQLQRGGLPL